MNKVYVSETGDPRRRKPVVRSKDKVKKYMHERIADIEGRIAQARRKCMDRGRWRLFCRVHPLGDVSGVIEASETIQ